MSNRATKQNLYNSEWRAARKCFLMQHPLCALCTSKGKLTPATVVDHKVRHNGDLHLFWSKDNWQSLCKHCHDSIKQKLETRGQLVGCDVNGLPDDPKHHWS